MRCWRTIRRLAVVPRAGLIHRLDKDTSGLLMVARTPEMHVQLVRLLQERRSRAAIWPSAWAAHRQRHHRRAHRPASLGAHAHGGAARRAGGGDALSHEERFRGTRCSRQLETGRTHQIRVHLATPASRSWVIRSMAGRRRLVAGAGEALQKALAAFRRQALHAQRLALDHPSRGATTASRRRCPRIFAPPRALRDDARAASDEH